MIRKTTSINNKLGLHARASAKLTKVAGDPRVECVMLPISDGLTMVRRIS